MQRRLPSPLASRTPLRGSAGQRSSSSTSSCCSSWSLRFPPGWARRLSRQRHPSSQTTCCCVSPLGGPQSGYRDVLDLLLFAAVAVVISELVRRAHAARVVAEQAAERERRAREDRDRLIATVTHDLATPLTVLSGTVQFVKRHGTSSEADLTRLLGRIETASARATALVRTLADAQALESRDFVLQTDTHDLRTLVRPTVEMMDRFSERHPIVLDAPDHPVNVNADGGRFQRVVENLINNAIKYSPDGGTVELSISATENTL
jgi:signal transduction histidine kinase